MQVIVLILNDKRRIIVANAATVDNFPERLLESATDFNVAYPSGRRRAILPHSVS